jgi:hypothetical protein
MVVARTRKRTAGAGGCTFTKLAHKGRAPLENTSAQGGSAGFVRLSGAMADGNLDGHNLRLHAFSFQCA